MTKSNLYKSAGAILLLGVSGLIIYLLTQTNSIPKNGMGYSAENSTKLISNSPETPKAGNETILRADTSDVTQISLNTLPTPVNNSFLSEAYLNSKNLRAFIDMAKQHPEKGGYWYAFMAGSYCAQVNGFQQGEPKIALAAEPQIVIKPGSNPEINQRRQSLLDELTSKCQGVTKDDFIRPSLSAEVKGQKDVAWAAYVIEDDLEKKVKAVMELKDPLLIYDVGGSLTMNSLDGSYYEGSLVPHQIAGAAWALLPCELGLPCGKENLYLKLQCVTQGICFDDLQSSVIHDYQSSQTQGDVIFDSATIGRIVALSKSMAENIRNKNVAAFLPPSKK